MTTLRDAALQTLEGLIENARSLGATQAKMIYGCYSPEDGRLERAWHENIAKRSATIRAALAEPQPQPEPVAIGTVGELFTNAAWERLDLRPSTKVYITPPQRQPLTASEVTQMLGRYNYETHGDWSTYIVRMTEKAHNIGGDK